MTRERNGSQAPIEIEGAAGFGDQVRMVVGIIALAALLLFFVQNLQEVQMHFLWFDWNTRLLFALFASAAVGGIATWLFSALRRRAKRAQRAPK
jgi:uncharacterized integral membrane protein